MKRTLILIAVLLIVAILLIMIALSSQTGQKSNNQTTQTKTVTPHIEPPATTKLSLSPTTVSLASSNSATIDVLIDTGGNKVTAVQLEIAYDPKVLTNISVSPGTFLPGAFVLLNNHDRTSGRISYALAIPTAQEPLTGSGKVASIHITKNNPLPTGLTAQQTILTLLPKSLVSAIDANGTVLKQTTNNTTIILDSTVPVNP